MQYRRMPIEIESPEQMGYDKIRNNLSESSYTDASFRDVWTDMSANTGDPGLEDLLLAYGSHQGHDRLRELIVNDNAALNGEQVLLTMGAAGALFIIATSLLEKDDELIVVRPNYSTNIETPRAIGATINYIDLTFENRWTLDIDRIRQKLTPKTRYISVTHPHNPTGACLGGTQLQALASLAETHGCYVLVDETYRDMVFGKQLPLAAAYSEKLISVSSLSKTYGLPGLRVGWLICRDRTLYNTFLAAKEQMQICGPILDEELAYRYLRHRDKHYPRIREDIKRKFAKVKNWIENQEHWEWVEPRGGCVGFPRLRHPGRIDIDGFYKLLLEKYGTYVGPGHWFEMPRHYIRLGFGWPSMASLEEGLDALSKAVEETTHR